MGEEKEFSEKVPLPEVASAAPEKQVVTSTPAPAATQNMSIQFAPEIHPGRTKLDEKEDLNVTSDAARRPSLPAVLSEKERARRRREEEAEKKTISLDEHLMPAQDVAFRYQTGINVDRPGASTGLTATQAEDLLKQHGLNVLTPPKKRHPLLKYFGKIFWI
jgi:hypothetical protein